MGSHFLRSLIAERQSPSNQEYFAIRASQCFSTSGGPSWLDVHTDVTDRETRLTHEVATNNKNETNSPAVLRKSVSLPASTVKLETEYQLGEFLDSHRSDLKIFFIRQRNSASRLSIGWSLFHALCQHCGVYEKIRDYVMCFGLRNGESEITPPAMHYHLSYQEHPRQLEQLECAYILRFVEPNNRQHGNPWSIRQSSVYSKSVYKDLSCTWIFIALSPFAETRIQEYLSKTRGQPDPNPFEIHYLLFDIAISTWRRYVVYLAEEIRQQADKAILADLETDGTVVTRFEERQYLKQVEDSVTDLISCLAFMLGNIDTLINYFQDFQNGLSLSDPKRDISDIDMATIIKGLEDRRKDLQTFDSQAQALRRKVESASNLVSNILDLNNGNVLKKLALESRAENANLSVLTRKSVQDAATVKVLTIVTLVYLPITVVTNIFSTQFVNSAERSNGTAYLKVIPEIWILFAISIPLTIFTIYIWWTFAQREIHGSFPGSRKRSVRRTDIGLETIRRLAPNDDVSS